MNKAVPWSIKGVDFDAREAAKEAARRAGMTLGEWLNSVIADKAADMGVDADDVDEDSRLEAITARLAKMSRREPASAASRRRERPASTRRPAAYEEDDAEDFEEDARPRRRSDPREASFAANRRPARRAQPDRSYDSHALYPDPDALLDEAARVFERGARRTQMETSAALAKVSRRLANIEAAIEDRTDDAPPNEVHKAISRLESRIDSIARPKPVDRTEATLRQLDRKIEMLANQIEPTREPSPDISRLESKINRLLGGGERPHYEVPAYEPAPEAPAYAQPARAIAGAPRSLTDAIAQISQRQKELDQPGARTPAARRPVAPANWQPPVVPPAPAPVPAAAYSLAPAPTYDPSLKNEIASLAARIDEMRRDSIAREEQLRREAAEREERLRREAEQREAELRREAEKRQEMLRIEQQRQEELRREAARAETTPLPQLETIRRQVADMTTAVSGLAPREAVASLETAVRDLTKRVESSRQEGVRETILQPIETLLRDVRHSLSDFAPRSTVDTIASELRSISTKINALGTTEVDHKVLARVNEQTQEIRNLLAAAVAHPLPIESIEKQIEALTDRVDFIAMSGASGASTDAVGQTVDEIRSSLDRSMPPSLLRTLEQRIESLAHKLDDAVAQSGASDQLDELTRRIDEVQQSLSRKFEQPDPQPSVDVSALESLVRGLAYKIDSAVSQSSSSDQLEALTSRINDVHRELSERAVQVAPAATADTSALEDMIRDLARKVDEASQSTDEGGGVLDGLQLQIARIAERLDRADGSSGSMAQLERLVSDLFKQLDENRTAAVTAAENAAHAAAQEVLRAAMATPPSVQVPESITRDLAHLKSLQDVADRRTHATLTAVHETLEKVVDRLAMLENDVVDVRVGHAMTRADTVVREATQHSFAETAPQIRASSPQAADDELEGWSPRAASDDARTSRTERSAPRLEDVNAPLGAPADVLIEPGSGFAPARRGPEPQVRREAAVLQEPEAPTPTDPRSAQSSFIAAARRAAQAASVEAAAAPQKTGAAAAVESALADARARARAAAAAMTDKMEQGEAKPSLLGKIKSAVTSRKRTLLLGVAALVLVAGSLQIARTMLLQRGPAPVIQIEAPANATDDPDMDDEAPSPTSPQRQGAVRTIKPTDVARATTEKTVPPGIDPSPVATITPAAPILANPTGVPSVDQNLQVGPLRDQAAKGVAAAQYELGLRYAEGRSVTRDLKLAAQWLEKAAAQDLAPAQYRLGSLYEKGYGVDKNIVKAKSWYTKAAEQGNVKAMHNLAVVLADGGGDKPDYVAAAQWFHKAAEHGVRDSQYNLAILYARGLGTPQNMQQAYSWFTIAAKQGDGEAAKKRDEVGARLTVQQLETAKAAGETFKPKVARQSANEVDPPAGGWDSVPTAADTKPAPTPTASPAAKPKTNLKAKVSNI
jgi:localization factor PodJL